MCGSLYKLRDVDKKIKIMRSGMEGNSYAKDNIFCKKTKNPIVWARDEETGIGKHKKQ